ncbi:hypothetical protein VN97_g5168 [Penicillium thymicola]|uniref:Uncharacterized protein n=1 Tax=Penicillium thymicola TaxID=293382 RepID=A0AAI9TIY5_PENTH|nr:hypothetical protein VN97_g5168 [Penicillium thymicola]
MRQSDRDRDLDFAKPPVAIDFGFLAPKGTRVSVRTVQTSGAAQPRESPFFFCASRPLTIPAAKVSALQIPVLRDFPETKASISTATKHP